MEALKIKIEADFKSALKEKNETKVSVLRMLKADILNAEKEKRYAASQENPGLSESELDKKSALAQEEVLDIILSKAKKTKESIAGFEKGNRPELAQKEKKELEILKEYMPQQLTEEEIKEMAKEVIAKTKVESIKDMGKVMSELMPQVKGKADGNLVSKVIRELLS